MSLRRPEAWAALAVVLSLVGAFLCFPRAGATPAKALHVIAFDTSGSRVRSRSDWASRYRVRLQEAVRAARAEGADFAVVRFGSQFEVWRTPGPPPDEDWVGTSEWWTDSFADGQAGTAWPALGAWLLERFPAGQPGRVWLESDGEGARATDFAFCETLRQRGVRILPGTTLAPTRPDGAILSGQLPERLPEGSPYRVELELAWRGPQPSEPVSVEARVRRSDGSDDPPWQTLGAWVPPTALLSSAEYASPWVQQRVLFEQPGLPQGWYTFEARLSVAGDRVPENQAWRQALIVGDPYLVLVDGDPGPLRAMWPAGSPPIAWQSAEAEGWEASLARADAVATFGRAPNELPGRALRSYLDGGGAWWFLAERAGLAGWGSLPPAGAVDLGAYLPLEVHYGDREARDVCLLVDGSGSMEGLGWQQVQSASAALLAGLPAQDGWRLHLFTQDLLPAALRFDPLPADASPNERDQARRVRERARRDLLTTRVPGGPTDILRSLQSFVQTRTSERPALALLITDGHESGVVPRDPAAVRAACLQARVDLRVVATGANPDSEFLERLLLPGEELVRADSWDRLEELLQREVLGEALREQPGLAVQAAPTAASADPVPPLTATASIDRYLRTRPRAGAQVQWSSQAGEPLLATVRRGEGWVAAAPISPTERFAREQVGGLRASLLQAAAWGRAHRQPGSQLVAQEERVHLLQAPSEPWTLWVQPGSLDQNGSRGESIPLRCEPLPPRFGLHPFQNQRVLDPPEQVAFAELRRPDGSVLQRLPWPRRVHPEWRPASARWPWAAGAVAEPADLPPPAGKGPHPAGPALLGLALGSLLISIGFLGSRGKESGV